uniref:Uncharacterized protein n=1 Tax=Arundo donax TaxID=35708 RepID=A0A0A9GP44_ARUDO
MLPSSSHVSRLHLYLSFLSAPFLISLPGSQYQKKDSTAISTNVAFFFPGAVDLGFSNKILMLSIVSEYTSNSLLN